MKGFLIGLGATLGLAAVYAVKKINDDRQEKVIRSEEGVDLISIETFKQAAKRKVNEILKWVTENTEKVESFVSVVSVTSTIFGLAYTAIELYSSSRRLFNDPQEELVRQVSEIRARLEYLTPDLQ